MSEFHLGSASTSRSYDGFDIDLKGPFNRSDPNRIFLMQRIQNAMRRFFCSTERSTSLEGNGRVPYLLVRSQGRSKRLSISNLYSPNEPLKIRYPKYCVDNRPSDCEYAKMCQDVYLRQRLLKENDSLPNAKDWKIHSIQEAIQEEPFSIQKEALCDYFSATYVNNSTQQIVVVYRGAERLQDYLLKKIEDRAVLNLFSVQKMATFTVVKSAVDLLKETTKLEEPYQLSFTGHSSGAFLAQLSVVYACIKFELMNVYAVTFEDVGAKESLERMQLKKKLVDLDKLDITSYVSSFPNGINAHFGTLCLISPHLEEIERPLNELLMDKKENKKPETMEKILGLFEKAYPHIPSSYIIDESSFGQKNGPSTDLKNKKGWGALKKSYKRNTNVELANQCDFKCYPDLSLLNDLPLRNFSFSLRTFLEDFDNKKSKSSNDQIRAVCQELNIPQKLTHDLIHYEYLKDIQMIRLRGGDIRNFRANLSLYLADYSDKILKLMPVSSNLTNPLTPLWGVPPKNESFIERTHLKNIKDSLKTFPVVVCDGSSGMGKTELALEFVWRNYRYYFKTAWFNAESIEMLLLEYDKLGKDLNLPFHEKMSIEERGLQVKAHLEDLDGPAWLLVYDNLQSYDESEGVGSWIPTLSGSSRVLITSRLSQGSCASIPIEKFSRDESIKCIERVLDKPLSEKEKQAVHPLVEALGDFPLGIVQAGAYIRETKVAVSHYLELYEKRKTALFQDKTSVKSASKQEENPSSSLAFGRNIVCVTWDISIGAIRREFALAENWLRVCSYLGDDIPDFLFNTFAKRDSLKDADQMLEAFNRYSILKRNEEDKTGSIHSLLREVIRMRVEKSETKAKTIVTVAHLLQKCVSDSDELKEDDTKIRQLLPHFEILLPKLEEIFNRSSKQTKWFPVYLIAQISLYVRLRDLRKKTELLARKLVILEQQYGKDSIQLIHTLIDLRKTYHTLGDRDQERLLLEQLRSIQEKYYGKDHVDLGKTLIALSKTYGALGDPHKQKELLKQADSTKIKDRNARDPLKRGIYLRRLGNVHILLGEMNKGKELIEEAHSILEESDGKGLQFSIVLRDLANVYRALGDPFKQKELAEQARFILEKCWDKDSVEMAQTLITLGTAYGALGDWQKQRELLEQALPILKQNCCKDYSVGGKALVALSTAYGALGDWQKQWELLQQAVAMLERYYGHNHFEVAVAMGNLANACANLWKVDEAERLLENALSILQESRIENDFEKAKTWVALGRTYNILKNPDEGRKLLQQALPILKKYYGKNHFEVAIAMGNLGNAYGALGKIDQAKKCLEKALPILEKHYGENHFEVAITLGNLGNVCSILMAWNQARKCFERALPILKEHYGEEHFAVAKVLVNLGNACIGSGDSNQATRLIKEALPILRKGERENHFEIDIAIKILRGEYNPLKDMHRF